jgi:hypothetical protein
MSRFRIKAIKTDDNRGCWGLPAVYVRKGDGFCVLVNRDHPQFAKNLKNWTVAAAMIAEQQRRPSAHRKD